MLTEGAVPDGPRREQEGELVLARMGAGAGAGRAKGEGRQLISDCRAREIGKGLYFSILQTPALLPPQGFLVLPRRWWGQKAWLSQSLVLSSPALAVSGLGTS